MHHGCSAFHPTNQHGHWPPLGSSLRANRLCRGQPQQLLVVTLSWKIKQSIPHAPRPMYIRLGSCPEVRQRLSMGNMTCGRTTAPTLSKLPLFVGWGWPHQLVDSEGCCPANRTQARLKEDGFVGQIDFCEGYDRTRTSWHSSQETECLVSGLFLSSSSHLPCLQYLKARFMDILRT